MGHENTSQEKENRSSILDSVSNWIKLVALIVLVMEAILLLAMTLTPASEPIFTLYPILMLLLALAVLAALFVDRLQHRKSDIEKIRATTELQRVQQTVKVDSMEISVDPEKSTTKELETGLNMFTDNMLQFSFKKPIGDGWHAPKFIKYADFVRSTYFTDLPDEQLEELITANSPYGKLFFNAKIVSVVFGDPKAIEMDANTSTESIEEYLVNMVEKFKKEGTQVSEEEIKEARVKLNQTENVSKIGFAVDFKIMAMDKNDIDTPFLDSSLPNLFLNFGSIIKEPIDSLKTDENSLLWTTKNKLKNVTLDGEPYASFSIYRLYRLLKNDDYIYFCSAQYSPQIEGAHFAWESLKKSFESFRILK
ncbi:MAG: hypothetical protein COA40_01965 [Aequorivita sp.]|nr:MAG: hypothetical protein COA40_01965 [Aequorivita sp.]